MEYITNYNQTDELIDSLSIEIENYLHDKVPYTEYFLNTGGWVEIDEIPIEISIFTCETDRKYRYNIIVINIKYTDKDDDDNDELVIRVSRKFDNVKELLQELEKVIRTYTIMDCYLVSPNFKKRIFLQRSFLFSISSNQIHCCICKNPTIEYTTCKHPICLQCRCKCILDGNKVCPVCKNGDLQKYPNQLRSVVDYCL